MMAKCVVLGLCLMSSAYALSGDEAVAFQRVFDVISSPKIYLITSEQMMLHLRPLCFASARSGRELIKRGNIECLDAVHASSFSAAENNDDRISLISSSFEGATKCAYMRKTLIRNFGPPTTQKGECNLEWWLRTPKGKPRRFIGFGTSPEDDKVYFSIGEEQGGP